MADTVLTNLVQQLGTFVAQEYQVLQGVSDELISLEIALKFMKIFLRDSEGKHEKHELVRELVEQIKEVAYETEDMVESFVLEVEQQQRRSKVKKALHFIHHTAMLKKVSQQIVGIKKKISDIYENKERFGIEMGEGSNNPHFEAALLRRRKEVDDDMVGFRDVEDSLLKQLTEGSTARNIISIVGMGGLGKTTVAKSLHNHRIIEDHFKYRAWVTVSEDYNTRQVVLDILNKVVFDVDGLDNQDTDKLKEKLTERLKNNKYIVFLDDVWHTNMWDEVQACFPDNNNGSRILITTRKADVARYASVREPHFLRFLKDDEGWELFEKKVFRGDPCPSNLKLVGVKIVERCKGLPLSIVVIASMLACQERSQRMWERTLMDVGAQLSKDEVCLDILALSYHNLPVMLKPCILYFAAFPEDHEMSVKRLIALWLAEGFIQPLGELSLDEVAESYLDDLIGRSLVQSGKRTADGRHKTCRIHDLVRDLCIREAKRENFLWGASKINNPVSSLITKRRPRRFSVHRHTTRTLLSKDWDPSSVRAFLSFESQFNYTSSALWKKLYTEYKLIRVLDLGASIKVTTIPDDIRSLVNLRYLRLCLSSTSIPISVFDLWNLKMLFFEGNPSLNIPVDKLLKLSCLEQLVLGPSKIFGNSTTLLSKMQLKSLRRLSSIFLDSDFESAVMNGLCPDLRKLSLHISYIHHWSGDNIFSGLPNLESLKMSFIDGGRGISSWNLKEADLPSALTKITLESVEGSKKVLKLFGKLPYLRILKLVDLCGYTEVDMREDAFPSLHTLHLDNVRGLDVGMIRGIKAFPQLRRLFMKRCINCKISRLLEGPSVKDVEVLWPDEHLAKELEHLKQKEIKYRLLVYRG